MRTQVAVLREWAEWIIKPEGFEIKEVVYLDSLFLFYLGFDAKIHSYIFDIRLL
jgi:hypothetical protein